MDDDWGYPHDLGNLPLVRWCSRRFPASKNLGRSLPLGLVVRRHQRMPGQRKHQENVQKDGEKPWKSRNMSFGKWSTNGRCSTSMLVYRDLSRLDNAQDSRSIKLAQLPMNDASDLINQWFQSMTMYWYKYMLCYVMLNYMIWYDMIWY